MEMFNTILSFLAGYQNDVNLGVFYGIIAATVAASITVMIYIIRWTRLLAHRRLDGVEEITAGRLEGRAEGLLQRKLELDDGGRKRKDEDLSPAKDGEPDQGAEGEG